MTYGKRCAKVILFVLEDLVTTALPPSPFSFFFKKYVTLRPRRSTRGNRRVSLTESQFFETQPRTHNASGILARL